MAGTTVREVRRRGLFGWIFLICFWVYNVSMVWWIVEYTRLIGAMRATSEAELAGIAIGAAFSYSTILFVWACGSVILGVLVLVTRGKKYMVSETKE